MLAVNVPIYNDTVILLMAHKLFTMSIKTTIANLINTFGCNNYPREFSSFALDRINSS